MDKQSLSQSRRSAGICNKTKFRLLRRSSPSTNKRKAQKVQCWCLVGVTKFLSCWCGSKQQKSKWTPQTSGKKTAEGKRAQPNNKWKCLKHNFKWQKVSRSSNLNSWRLSWTKRDSTMLNSRVWWAKFLTVAKDLLTPKCTKRVLRN